MLKLGTTQRGPCGGLRGEIDKGDTDMSEKRYPTRMNEMLGGGVMEWISVKDRLPEAYRHVLTYDEGDIREGYLTKQGHWMGKWNGASDTVTHWMPLPLPPKEEAASCNLIWRGPEPCGEGES